MKTYFACSDIHSFYWEWMQALHSAGFDVGNPDHIIILCGDVFDRGDESVECFEFMKILKEHNQLIYIRGNHEDLLFKAVNDIDKGLHIGGHHISNGTIKTISHFLDTTEYDVLSRTFDWKKFDEMVNSTYLPFIAENSIDYFELGDYVFVHGWVPTTADEEGYMTVGEDWKNGDWNEARWENGMEMSYFDVTIPNKTIVCGHWHTSWGWHIKEPKKYSEWGPNATFRPFFSSGVIALDACTAINHFVNVVKFTETDDGIKVEELK